jgi:hypothetical protein
MKTLLLLCAAAGLTGCAVYPAPYDNYGGAVSAPYGVVEQPVYLYGSGVYRADSYPQPVYPRAYHRPPPPPVVVVPQQRPPRPFVQGPPRRGDRDGDGVPNRMDRDRDGDGIPNRFDRDRNNDGIRDRAGPKRDRDGDGIPDSVDPRPLIPNRR